MILNEIQTAVHDLAIEKGWRETNRNVGELIALAHSELSEALEEYRNLQTGANLQDIRYAEDGKPEGFFIELADLMIRVLDNAERYGVSMEEMIKLKHKYNTTRPYRHGGKKA